MVGHKTHNTQHGFHLSGVLAVLLTTFTTTYKMNIEQLLIQATRQPGEIDIVHYTNLVLQEACRLVKDTPTTSAYTSFDQVVAETQRADCFKAVYNQIVRNIEDAAK
jgi:hypothetical protein